MPNQTSVPGLVLAREQISNLANCVQADGGLLKAFDVMNLNSADGELNTSCKNQRLGGHFNPFRSQRNQQLKNSESALGSIR